MPPSRFSFFLFSIMNNWLIVNKVRKQFSFAHIESHLGFMWAVTAVHNELANNLISQKFNIFLHYIPLSHKSFFLLLLIFFCQSFTTFFCLAGWGFVRSCRCRERTSSFVASRKAQQTRNSTSAFSSSLGGSAVLYELAICGGKGRKTVFCISGCGRQSEDDIKSLEDQFIWYFVVVVVDSLIFGK